MSRDDGEGAGVGNTRKNERKRQREKQRRSDLSNACDELAAVLSRIEPDETDRASSSNKKRKTSIGEAGDGDGDSSGTTRLDLIVRTIDMLKQLHADNVDLRNGSEREYGDDPEVMMMVPSLTSTDDSDQNRALAASYPPHYQHQAADRQPLSDRQSDHKHPYPQPYQQHYHEHYLQPQECSSNSVPYYSEPPHGHHLPYYGQSCWSDAGQYPQQQGSLNMAGPQNHGGYTQYTPLLISNSGSHGDHSQDEDDESHNFAKTHGVVGSNAQVDTSIDSHGRCISSQSVHDQQVVAL